MRSDAFHVVRMLECADRVSAYTRVGREEFLLDSKCQDAVVRNLEVIGEAARRVPADIRKRAPDIPWDTLARLRELFNHLYEDVDAEQLWLRCDRDLPPMRRALVEFVDRLDRMGWL